MTEPTLDVAQIAWPTQDQPLLTERLVLRPHRPDDLEDLLRFHADPDVVRWTPWVVKDHAATEEFLAKRTTMTRWHEPGDWLVLAVQRRDDGRVVGEVLLKWEGPGQAEVGYALASDQHGQGLAREAVAGLFRYAFDVLGVHRVVAIIVDANDASTRLAEQVGMTREAHLVEAVWFKGAWASEYVYAIRAEQFRQSPDLG
ncbi:MAG: GNAT family N-acetyltransferase [Nocardioides sp.]|uniref:GNAT family N-acetyltransferase n=1 Tax=Nocardioides sp. TaxID=35761 RepID=UPI003F0FE68E